MPLLRSLAVVLVLCAGVAMADEPSADDAAAPAKKDDKPAADAAPVTTSHTLEVNGGALKYTATAGTLPIESDTGERQADVFFVAYTLDAADPAAEAARRPITFVFNGGPGAAAVWLHLGTAGPQVLHLTESGDVPAPPHSLEPNPYTWLTATDLVMIDPVGTGFSRAAKDVDATQFYSVDGDIRAVGEFIRRYLTRYERWPSPKFIAGESYGTTRAAGLAEHLLESQGVALNGVILISTVLDFGTIRVRENNPLPYALFLPTYTAAAHRHGRLPEAMQARPLDEVTAEAERWAMREYLAILALDDALPAEERAAAIETLAGFTGLPASLLDAADLRVAPSLFQKALLGDSGRIVGRFDSRITGATIDPIYPWAEYDPSLSRYLPAYVAAFNGYVRTTLGYETDLKYEALSDRVHPWDFGGGNEMLDVTGRLRAAMVKQPAMGVFIASGRFDLATPYLATRHTIDGLDLPPDLRDNLTHALYPAGHMMYHEPGSLQQLHADLAGFIAAAAPGRGDEARP